MLVWEANFQIQNSGIQAAIVYVVIEPLCGVLLLTFYSDKNRSTLLWEETLEISEPIEDPYAYVLSLEKFSCYKRV